MRPQINNPFTTDLPIPEVNQLKEELSKSGALLAKAFNEIDRTFKQARITPDLEIEANKFLKKKLNENIDEFYDIGGPILIIVGEYALKDDRAEFDRFFEVYVHNDLEKNRTIDILRDFTLFVQRLLKNSNITELGHKPQHDRIMERL
jgi:hypothetical protein